MNTIPNTFKHILSITGSIALLMGCSVDPDVRCNRGQAPCPETFYCGGEWCYPEGTGPGAIDMAATPDMQIDGASPDMTQPDMARPDMRSVDMSTPDVAVADMAVADMAVAQILLGPVAPRDGVLSSAPAGQLVVTLIAQHLDGPYDLQVGFLRVEPDVIPDPDACRLGPFTPREVVFDGGLATLPIDVDDMPADVNPIRICIVDPVAGGAIITVDARVDAVLPSVRIDAFETNADRSSGILPVAIESDDVERAAVLLFGGDDCQAPYEGPVDRVESPDKPRNLSFVLTELAVGTRYSVSLQAADAAGNSVCFPTDFVIDPPPEVDVNAIFCEKATRAQPVDRLEFALNILDDDPASVTVALVADATTCADVNLIDLDVLDPDVLDPDPYRVSFECIEDCVITLEVGDAVGGGDAGGGDAGGIVVAIPVDAFDPDAPLFRSPLALSYLVESPLGATTPSGAVHTRRDGVDTVIVGGRSGDSSRMMQWRVGANGWQGSSSLNLAGVPMAGQFISRDAPQTFVANIGGGEAGNLSSEGCGAVLLANAPFALVSAFVFADLACSVQPGNYISSLQAVNLGIDEYDDVVARDSRGRIDWWQGDLLNISDAMNLYAGAPDLPMAIDFAAIAGIERVVIALDQGLGAQVIDLEGGATPLFAGQPVSCVAAVDWLADGTPGVALCLPDRLAILSWQAGVFVPVAEVLVPLGDGFLTDVVFERADHPAPSALWVDNIGRAGIIDAGGLTIWDTPEPVRAVIDMNPNAFGFDAALLARSSSRIYWLLSDDSAVAFAHREIGPNAGIPQMARPIGGVDVTGDYVSDILFFATVGDAQRLQAGGVAAGQWTAHVVDAFEVRADLYTAVGDFNADGRSEVASVRERDDGAVALEVGRTDNPDDSPRVRINDTLNLRPMANAPLPWALATGPLRRNTSNDLIALGMDQELRIYQTDLGVEQNLEDIALIGVIPDVEPGEIVIADFNGVPAVFVFRQEQQPNVVRYEAWSIDGTSLGTGQRIGTLQRTHTANIQTVRKAFLTVLNADNDAEVLRVDGPNLSLIYSLIGGEIADFAVGDLDGDQRADLVLAVESRGDARGETVRTLYRQVNGVFSERLDERYVAQAGSTLDAVYIGDFDGDRRPDRATVLTSPEGERVVVLSGRTAN
ncbi:MAG: hypothetical protein ACI9U2_001671 [Bradymonadia bacterium]|jgi:hypothetical protein